MPVFKVLMKCQLENLTNIRVPSQDFDYNLKVQCTSCNEVSDKWQVVSSSESHQLPGSRGEAHYVAKCKLCSKVNSLNVLVNAQGSYTAEDVPRFKAIASFECRGLTVQSFRFGDGWSCDSTESKKTFTDVCLDEDFCDYDDLGNCPVSVTEVEWKIE
ncbi:Protein of unknown function DUF866 eukaryotic [Trinorchestia longiramus]|nr:Protein of unknown function DUF866 eukaryotic [Trinorchestia longiramus]